MRKSAPRSFHIGLSKLRHDFVDVEATILYRIIDPLLLIQTLGPGQNFITQGISPKAIPYLKESLGELTTEDFYNSPLRVEKAEKARDLLNAEMLLKGIQVEHVLIRYFEYTPEIQRNIEEKKLQDQLVFRNQSEGRAATEAAEIQKIIEEGEANVLVTLQEGEAYKITKDAERDLYVRTKTAEADLLGLDNFEMILLPITKLSLIEKQQLTYMRMLLPNRLKNIHCQTVKKRHLIRRAKKRLS